MLTRLSIFALAAMSVLAFGCSKSADNGAGQNPPPAAVSGPTQQDRTAHEAKMVVSDFLNALRRGDDVKAKSLLTKVARQKAEEQNRTVAPGASDSAKIEVDDATFPAPDEHEIAHVPARWIDQDEMGKPQISKATWVCRLEPEGWRVAGSALYVFDGEDPIFMNFEDPEDMERHRQMMNEEIERRSKATSPARSSGENPLQAERNPKDAFQR
jgi:hypothetical protein